MGSLVLNDAVFLITGAGKGIGAALVEQICQRRDEMPGVRLFLTSRTKADLEALKTKAKAAGIVCEYLAADLAEKPTEALDACLKAYGRLDVLFHSAGVGRFGDFSDLKLEDLQFVMKTNVEASFVLIQKAYAQIKSQAPKQGKLRGQIQWVTSVASEKPFPQSAIYCMSKFAQRGLLEVIRSYGYQDGIRLLEVKPGATLTPMWGDVSPEMKTRMMPATDIANSMVDTLFLSESTTVEELTIRPLSGDL